MRKLLRFLAWMAVVLGALIGLARVTAVRWVRVPESDPVLAASVTPTVSAGDLVVLWRLTAPKLGDLVVCARPDSPTSPAIGRIVGVAGDEISVGGNELVVNGRHTFNEWSCYPRTFEVTSPISGEVIEQGCDLERLHDRLHPRGRTDETKPGKATHIVVPDGKAFLVSDNRKFPFDSRDYGPVDRSTCQETIVLRLVSKKGYFDTRNRFTLIR